MGSLIRAECDGTPSSLIKPKRSRCAVWVESHPLRSDPLSHKGLRVICGFFLQIPLQMVLARVRPVYWPAPLDIGTARPSLGSHSGPLAGETDGAATGLPPLAVILPLWASHSS